MQKDDLISRQAAIENSFEVYTKEYGWCEVVGVDAINSLPPAQPEPKWIPCSERLPEEDGQYIVTVKYEHVDGYEDIYSEHGEWVDGHWDACMFGHCGRVEKVLAWQPLPKPWENE